MSKAIPISNERAGSSYHLPSSPTISPVTHSPIAIGSLKAAIGGLSQTRPKALKPFAVKELKLLLLENISQEAVHNFKSQGFQVDHYTKAWTEDELVAKIGEYHAISIRSKTKITQRVLQHASKVGCTILGSPSSVLTIPLSSFSPLDVFALEQIKWISMLLRSVVFPFSTHPSPIHDLSLNL